MPEAPKRRKIVRVDPDLIELQPIGIFDPKKGIRNLKRIKKTISAATTSLSSSKFQKEVNSMLDFRNDLRDRYSKWAQNNEKKHIKLLSKNDDLELIHFMFGGEVKLPNEFKSVGERTLDKFHTKRGMEMSRLAHSMIRLNKVREDVEYTAKLFEKSEGSKAEALEEEGTRLDREIEAREKDLADLELNSPELAEKVKKILG